MNDIKHVMLPRLNDSPKPVKHQPWYKERIKNKYMNSKNGKSEKFLDGKNWTFIKPGLDDFRDGIPPAHENVVQRPPDKGLRPTLIKRPELTRKGLLPKIRRQKLETEKNSHMMTLTQAKRERVEQLIYGLSQHPLALYSHFEESLPADLFEEIVNLLDPDMNQITTGLGNEHTDGTASQYDKRRSNMSIMSRDSSAPPQKKKESVRKTPRSGRSARSGIRSASSSHTFLTGEKRPVRNTYKWLLRKEEAKEYTKPDTKQGAANIEEQKTQAIEGHIRKVTEDFCNWVRALGGEHNIDPVTLGSLFASGYETKPALSVPIHVVELANIPSELRNSVSVATLTEDADKAYDFKENMKLSKTNKKHVPKNRYGAWYLPKKLWRNLKEDEKLIDPKLMVDKEKEEAKKRAEEMNAKLAPLHGTNSFKDYIKAKNSHRVPKMLDEIDEWQHEQALRSISQLAINENPEVTADSTDKL